MVYVLIVLVLYAIFIAGEEDYTVRGFLLYMKVSRYGRIVINREYPEGTETETAVVLSRRWNDIRLSSDMRGVANWTFQDLGEMLSTPRMPYRHMTGYSYKIIKDRKS